MILGVKVIKTIIKRNGSREDFKADKVNGWGEWAAKTLGGQVDWSSAVLHAATTCPEECTSEQLQNSLIDFCLDKKNWEYSRMAGRLYSALYSKTIYGKKKPTIKALHETLYDAGLMVKLNYSDEEYALCESIIDHSRDLKMAHYQLKQIRNKYSLKNKSLGIEYETAQFVYMRMAMALAENEKDKMDAVKNFYDFFSQHKINAPTPNFVNLGTKLNGYASCCVYTTDDNIPSLAAGDHIAYIMTSQSAGIGAHIKTRSLKEPIRKGLIEHQGKIPYYKAIVAMTGANLQNGRGGAATVHYTWNDPEVEVIQKLRNPMTPTVKRVAGVDYSFGSNKFLARAVAKDESVSLFSYLDNKELYEAQYKADGTFEKLYAEFMASDKPKTLIPARKLVVGAINEAFETGRHYLHQTDTLNHHTPFLETIWSSNLCQEIALVSKAYKSVVQLYEEWNETHGEIGLCSIGGVIVSNITSDEEYAKAAYWCLRMIDICIHKSDYPFKSLEHTAKSRMSAGVGILGLAHLMAKKGLKYSSQEGRDFIHTLNETHYWHLVNASLKISKERGLAPWMHKTKWPSGWLPIDTYEKKVDELVTVGHLRDWETLRAEIVKNGGIGHSVICAHMPGESSTIGAGTTNSAYPIRDFDLIKTNDTDSIQYVVPDSTKLRNNYEIAWDISTEDMIKVYSIMQKWTDQAISADFWKKVQGDAKIGTKEIISDYLNMVKYGMKTRYYVNNLTAKGIVNNKVEEKEEDAILEDSEICESCSL